MSFIERHKTWLLPLLAVGVGAVIWYDLRSLGEPAPGASAAETAPGQAAPEPPAASAPSAPGTGAPEAPAASADRPPLGPDAWADLRYLNAVPGPLGQPGALTVQATRPLGPDLLAPPSEGAAFPPLRSPATLALPPSGQGSTAPPPDLDFISRTPEGLRAWYQGLGFRAGETILGTSYRIREIRPPRVVLEGPAGTVVQSTFLLEHPAPSQETP